MHVFHCEETRPLVSIFTYIDAMLLNLEAPVPALFFDKMWGQILHLNAVPSFEIF
jgi:hypothetical protein